MHSGLSPERALTYFDGRDFGINAAYRGGRVLCHLGESALALFGDKPDRDWRGAVECGGEIELRVANTLRERAP
jgi:hypothetical protein